MPRLETPAYLIPPTSPWIKKYRQVIESMRKPENNTLKISIPPINVEDGDVSTIQEVIASLQHHPTMIEKMLFSIELVFSEIEDSPLNIEESEWKVSTKHHLWFHELYKLPISLFFIRDRDSRFYILMGDLLDNQDVSAEEIEGRKGQLVSFSEEQAQLIMERLFQSCWLFYVYCYKSGFDPQVCIEAVLAELDSHITYDLVQKYAEERLEEGILFGVKLAGEK